ncbi:hypothetical protein POM88_006636 [Heracleum sosnowskyi]|uniref:Reverse transcriptase n=1 Tax=Heracleum sosnowskyi TaxID=360622 RepID=A0AAD8J409_9APIA|nr:hypothetical protein POM88_006636 [Heracleum sosnowskyi]
MNYLVGKIAPIEEEEEGEDEISRTSNEEIRDIDLGKIEMAKGSQVDKLTEQHDKEEVLSKDFLNNDLSGDVQAEGLNMAAKGDRDKDRFLDKMENKASRVRSRETSSDSYNISEDKNSDSRKSGDGSVSFDVDKGTESSEVSICNNLGSLKMGKRPGRPKKKKRVFKNPFDLGLNIKNEIGKGCKKKRAQGDKNSRADAKVEVVTKSAKESADEIISTAQLLGLELAGRREEEVLSVERKLKEGDFNCVREERERSNCEYRKADSVLFNDFIQDCNLMDLEPQNSTFTWFGKDGKRSKLDRFLLDSVWFSKCQWKVHALGRKHSDHKALILSVEEKNWGGKPFKFFNWWLQEPECVKVIQNFLKSNRAIEVENFQVLLKIFKTEVKGWSRNAKQKLEDNLKLLEDKQDSLDVQNEWNPDAVWCRNELLKGYAKKDSMLRQRARINWSIQGDRNSKFFHQKILRRAYVNGIKKIVWKEKCFSHPESIKSIFFNYFSDFFSKDSGPRVFFLGSFALKLLS